MVNSMDLIMKYTFILNIYDILDLKQNRRDNISINLKSWWGAGY